MTRLLDINNRVFIAQTWHRQGVERMGRGEYREAKVLLRGAAAQYEEAALGATDLLRAVDGVPDEGQGYWTSQALECKALANMAEELSFEPKLPSYSGFLDK